MPDSDLEIRGGEGGGSSRPLDKEGALSPIKIFRPFGPQFGLKIRGDPGPLGRSPGSATDQGFLLGSGGEGIGGMANARLIFVGFARTEVLSWLMKCPVKHQRKTRREISTEAKCLLAGWPTTQLKGINFQRLES